MSTTTKRRYIPAGSGNEYVVVDTTTGRPVIKLTGFDFPHPDRESAAAEAERLNRAFARAMET